MSTEKIQRLNVIVIGHRQVGKTSLLAAMHEEFHKTFASVGLNTWVDDTMTLDLILDCKEALKNIDKRLKNGPDRTPILEDPWSREGFIFKIGHGGQPFMEVHFHDPSGDYFAPSATERQKEYTRQQLQECDAVLIVTDATALMEKKIGRVKSGEVGPWHEELNSVERITLLLKDAYTHLAKPRLVLFVPTKCETYMRKEEDTYSLVQHIRLGYSELLSFLQEEAQYPKVAIAVTPVQTIGNVVYSHCEMINGYPMLSYHKLPLNAPYAPQDGDQPLRYILRFLLNVYVESKNRELEKIEEQLDKLRQSADAKKEAYKKAEQEATAKREELNSRNRLWRPLRSLANLFDDIFDEMPKTKYDDASKVVEQRTKEAQEVATQMSQSEAVVQATQAQIQAFNDAIIKFSASCKEEKGFRILQGRNRWLSPYKISNS